MNDSELKFKKKELALHYAYNVNNSQGIVVASQTAKTKDPNIEKIMKDAETVYKWLSK